MPDKVCIKDIGVKEFFSFDFPPTLKNTYLRAGIGEENEIPVYDYTGCPLLAGDWQLVYPVSKDVGNRLFTNGRDNS